METLTASETQTTLQEVVKPLVLPLENHQKIFCDGFIHIDIPPFNIPTRDQLATTIFEVRVETLHLQPRRFMVHDLLPLKLQHVGDCLAIASHGITASNLELWIKNRIESRISEIKEKKKPTAYDHMDLQRQIQLKADPRVVVYQYFFVDNNG
jgi:hypothetical protein